MRWKEKPDKPGPQNKDTRIIRHLLLIPRCINDEYRWLEFATIEQSYSGCWFDSDNKLHFGSGWKDKAWCDK